MKGKVITPESNEWVRLHIILTVVFAQRAGVRKTHIFAAHNYLILQSVNMMEMGALHAHADADTPVLWHKADQLSVILWLEGGVARPLAVSKTARATVRLDFFKARDFRAHRP